MRIPTRVIFALSALVVAACASHQPQPYRTEHQQYYSTSGSSAGIQQNLQVNRTCGSSTGQGGFVHYACHYRLTSVQIERINATPGCYARDSAPPAPQYAHCDGGLNVMAIAEGRAQASASAIASAASGPLVRLVSPPPPAPPKVVARARATASATAVAGVKVNKKPAAAVQSPTTCFLKAIGPVHMTGTFDCGDNKKGPPPAGKTAAADPPKPLGSAQTGAGAEAKASASATAKTNDASGDKKP